MTYEDLEPGMFLDEHGLLLEKVDDGGLVTMDFDDPATGALYWHTNWRKNQVVTFTERFRRGTETYRKHVRRMINERRKAIEFAQQDIAKMESFL